MPIIFLLSGEHVSLAKAEAKAQNPEAQDWQETERTLRCNTNKPTYERLALTKQAHDIIAKGEAEEITTYLQEPKPTSRTVSVECIRPEGGGPSSEEARKLLIPWLGRPKIDLDSPEETYSLITLGDEWLVTRKMWTNEEDFGSRKNQHRPAPHPTSLDPKLARAMVNLAGPAKEVLDPFCGSGGILLEASLIGLQAKGIDIDPAMLTRAKKNLEAFGAKAELKHGDATTTREKADAIITDLPYGRNSKAKDLKDIYRGFLSNANRLTSKMVIAFPDLVDGEELLRKNGWRVEGRFSWRLHRTLRKEVFIATTDAPARRPR